MCAFIDFLFSAQCWAQLPLSGCLDSNLSGVLVCVLCLWELRLWTVKSLKSVAGSGSNDIWLQCCFVNNKRIWLTWADSFIQVVFAGPLMVHSDCIMDALFVCNSLVFIPPIQAKDFTQFPFGGECFTDIKTNLFTLLF